MNAMVWPATGEVIFPHEQMAVFAAMHPLKTGHQIVMVPVGSSIAEIVEECGRQCGVNSLTKGVLVEVNGVPVPEVRFDRVRLKVGNHVVVRAVPGDFIATPIALAIAGGLGVTSSLGVGLITAAVTAGIGLIAQLVMSSVFPPSTQEANNPKTLYSIGGARNEVAKWEPIPSILGRVRVAAKYAAKPYTENAGDDQYVRMLLIFGYGPLDISQIKIGETPIEDYRGADSKPVEYEVFTGVLNPSDYPVAKLRGKPDHYNQTIYPKEAVQDDLNVTVRPKDGWVYRTTAQDAMRIQVDIVFPRGIYELDGGGYEDQSVKFTIEYRRVGSSGSWSNLRTVEMRGDSTDPIRLTYSEKVDTGHYEVRVRNQSKNYSEDDEQNHSVNFTWSALRIFRDSPPIEFDKPLAGIAVRIKATDQLDGTPDDINAVCQTRGMQYQGSDVWESGRTLSNPGDLFRHVLQGAANARKQPNGRIDFPTVQAFRNRCEAKNYRFNMVRDFRSSVWETLRDICAAGRGVPIFRDGKWSVAWEDAGAPIVQHFTPYNSWGFEREQQYRNLPHALRVKFLNDDKAWVEDERLVFNDGYDKSNATLIEMAEFPGITDPGLIHKHGRYRLAEGKLRPTLFRLSTDYEHLVCTRGDRVVVGHDVLINNLGNGRVKAISGNVVTLSDPVAMEAGKSYAILFRKSDGTFPVRTVVTSAGLTDTITLAGSGPLPTVPNNRSAGDQYSFGEANRVTTTCRIKSIRPGPNLSAQLGLVDDAPEIEDADDRPIPDYDSGIQRPIDLTKFPPKNLRIKTTREKVNGRLVRRTWLLWDVASVGDILYFLIEAKDRNRKVTKLRSPGGAERRIEITDLKGGPWEFTARTMFDNPKRNRSSGALRAIL